MEEVGQTATNDPELDRMREALTGHNAKPFLVARADNGACRNWYDNEEHAIQAARFQAKGDGVARVVYRAIVLVEPVRGNIALITHTKAPPRAAPEVVTA